MIAVAAGLIAAGLIAAGLLAAPAAAATPEQVYDAGNFPPRFSSSEFDPNPSGSLQSIQPAGGVADTSANPFFQSLGTNGRSCATCHQPPSAMSVSVANIQARYTATNGRDPIFAPIDGATCPAKATGTGKPASAFSLLLNQGLFRIALTVPANAQYSVTVLSDPYGCNTNPQFDQTTDPKTGKRLQVVSVYRRPLMAANLPFVTTSIAVPPNPVARPPAIMWDARETSLRQQAIDATLGHAQALTAPTASQLNAIVAFESGIYAAQAYDQVAGKLSSAGAAGGPFGVFRTPPGQFPPAASVFPMYDYWENATGSAAAARRASIYRGQLLFGTRQFSFNKVEGINPQPFVSSCARCHGQPGAGNDPHGQTGRVAIGIGGSSPQQGGPQPAANLPIFRVTCTAPFTTQYHGAEVVTNDPGAALATGQCADIEKFKTAPLRGLAARAPYFHDGSAATLTDVVNFYNTRFSIGLSAQDSQDLVNFLAAL